jgi:hypothetical protein
MVPTLFSTDDKTWPLMAVLTWIATRSLKFVESFVDRDFIDAQDLLTSARLGYGTPPNIGFAEAFRDLSNKIDAKEIRGRAIKLKWIVQPEHELLSPEQCFALAQSIERFESSDFRPQELRNAHLFRPQELRDERSGGEAELHLGDFVFHDVDCLTPKGSGYGSPNPDGSRTRWTWKGVTFARNDVFRLWHDWDCFAAWKQAKAQIWKPPPDLSPDWLNNLPPGQYVSIADVVALLAFGPDLMPIGLNLIEESAARFRAGLALIDAARDAKVSLWGYETFRMPHLRGGLAPVSGPMKIEPEFLVNATLVIDGGPDWIGPIRFADEFPERGQATESVEFVGVLVHSESLRRWLADLAGKPAPKKRGPKFQFDWSAVEGEAIRLMDKHGDFSPLNPNWNAQARLESALLNFCSQTFAREPGQTQLRTHISEWLKSWRQRRT